MSEEPYRPAPSGSKADAELARQAAEGQRRILDARASGAAARRDDGDKQFRVALGGHYGSPVKIASWTMIALGGSMILLDLLSIEGLALPLWVVLAEVPILVGGFALLAYAPTRASRARVAAERAWLRALPFAMDGYVEVLSHEPQPECRLRIAIAWSDPAASPREDVLGGVLGLVDTAARVESRDGMRAVIQSGAVSGRTRTRVNSANVYRNTRLVAYLHDLVDKVLLPLHRSHAIARVSLTRD